MMMMVRCVRRSEAVCCSPDLRSAADEHVEGLRRRHREPES